MRFLKKIIRQLGVGPERDIRADGLDDEFRKLGGHLSPGTKRNLIKEYGTRGASARGFVPERPSLDNRRATAPTLMPVSERELVERKKELTPEDYARTLLNTADLPDLTTVKELYKALKKADEGWVADFREANGMAGIYKIMAELAESRDTYMQEGDDANIHEVPEEDVQLEVELVQCVMLLLNKPQGLITLEASSELLPLLAGSAMDSTSSYVKCNLLKLLTIVSESGGYESVMNALDYQKVEKEELDRFSRLVEVFGDADTSGLALVTDSIVFFNTILSSAYEFEDRVHLRTEMITAGILEAIQRLREYYGIECKGDDNDSIYTESQDGRPFSRSSSTASDSSVSTLVLDAAMSSEISELAAQLDLFDTVMEEDRKDAIEAGVTVADPDVDDDDKDVMLDEIEEETVEEQIEVAPMVVEYPPDPPAVQSVRSALEKLKGQDEAINMLILIADKLERMANAHCGKKHWKRISDDMDEVLEDKLMGSDEDDDDEDEDMQVVVPKSMSIPPVSLPAPACRTPSPLAPLTPGGTSVSPRKVATPPPLPARPATTVSAAPVLSFPVLPGVAVRSIPALPALSGVQARPIPAAPALPGVQARPTPAAPALSGVSSASIPASLALPGVTPRAIPAPPALPGVVARAIPMAPALPGVTPGAIPTPPMLPGAAGIPAAPPLPGVTAGVIPTPPALPGAAGIPAAPPLPGVTAGVIPTPPALPGAAGIPAAPPLPGGPMIGRVPLPPPLPGATAGRLPLPPPLPGARGIPAASGLPAVPMAPRGLLPPRGLPAPVLKKPAGPKRRPVHWEKIAPNHLEKTVFSEIDPNSVDLPVELLAEAFVEKPKEKAAPGKETGKGDAAAAAVAKKKAEKISLLDSKALRNNGIVLKRFRTKPHDLRDSLVAMDLAKFDTEKFIALRGICPTPDDLPKLKSFDGGLDKLDEVTLFMVLTARIPRYQQRLDCALFMKAFEGDADFLSKNLRLVDTARMEVVDSPRLKRLIEVVLAMGNYLNEGTRNGEARAIKLSSLLKLETVKTMDKKKTLLHVLMDWANKKEPDLLKLDEDLVHASEASHWSLPDLKNQVSQVTKGFTLMQNQLKMAKGAATTLEGDKFVHVVEPFLEKAQERMESLEAQYAQVQGDYDRAAERFGESPSKMTSGDFFALVSSLVDMIAVAVRENEMAAKADERRKKREEQEKKRRAAQEAKQREKEAKKRDAEASGPPAPGRGLLSRSSIRPSQKDAFRGGRRIPSGKNEGRLGDVSPEDTIVQAMLNRRRLVAVEPGDVNSDSDSDGWDDDEPGEVDKAYDRIKHQRVTEGVMIDKMNQLKDPSKREIVRGQLPYQKSTIGRQQSMVRQRSSVGVTNPAILKQLAAVRQASNLRQMAAIRQASTVRRAVGSRLPSILRPSEPGVGMHGRDALSTGRLESRRFPAGAQGLSRREMSAEAFTGVRDHSSRASGGAGADKRRHLKTLRSVAFLAV